MHGLARGRRCAADDERRTDRNADSGGDQVVQGDLLERSHLGCRSALACDDEWPCLAYANVTRVRALMLCERRP